MNYRFGLFLFSLSALVACDRNVPIVSETRTISVSGVSEITVAPDTAEISLQISHVNPTIEASRSHVQRDLSSIVEKLGQIGIAEDAIRQSQIQQGKKHRWEKGRQVTEGYYSRVNLTLEMGDLNKMTKVYDVLASFDGVSLHNTRFKVSNEKELRVAQSTQALKNAEDKAKKILDGLNERVGHVIQVVEQGANMPISQPFAMETAQFARAEADLSPHAQIEFSDITIRATIQAKFSIKP